MKKANNLSKITVTLVAISITMVMAVGCGNKAATTSTKTTTSSTQAADTTTTGTQATGTSSITTLYSDTLKGLVTAGTITQTQSDKVLEVLKKDAPGGQGGAPSAGTENSTDTSKSAGTKPSGTPPTDTNKSTGAQPNGTQPTDKNPNSNRLSELVTSKVITQAQADTINQKIEEAMKNNQPSKTNQSNQSNQTTTQTK